MTTQEKHMTASIAGRPPLPAELLRLQRGITRRAVAEATGLDATALYRIEKGHAWPMPPTILRLAAALSLSAEEMAVALLRGWLIQHSRPQPEDRAVQTF
jgi:transcriptional regulator with XRE-family HTH domain